MAKISDNKKMVMASIVGLLLVGALAGLLIVKPWSSPSPTSSNNKINYSPTTEAEQTEGEQTKLSQADDEKTPEAQPPKGGRAEINSLSQDANTKNIVIQTKLYDVTWKRCTVTLTRNSFIITKSSDVLFNKDFSTCMGFVISNDDLPEAGIWNVALAAEQSDGKPISAAAKTINVIK